MDHVVWNETIDRQIDQLCNITLLLYINNNVIINNLQHYSFSTYNHLNFD